jgi:hypothetical protein
MVEAAKGWGTQIFGWDREIKDGGPSAWDQGENSHGTRAHGPLGSKKLHRSSILAYIDSYSGERRHLGSGLPSWHDYSVQPGPE